MAMDELERLRQKFDVDQSSLAELDGESPRGLLTQLHLHAGANVTDLDQPVGAKTLTVDETAQSLKHGTPETRGA